jgi:hypothetical protein
MPDKTRKYCAQWQEAREVNAPALLCPLPGREYRAAPCQCAMPVARALAATKQFGTVSSE